MENLVADGQQGDQQQGKEKVQFLLLKFMPVQKDFCTGEQDIQYRNSILGPGVLGAVIVIGTVVSIDKVRKKLGGENQQKANSCEQGDAPGPAESVQFPDFFPGKFCSFFP